MKQEQSHTQSAIERALTQKKTTLLSKNVTIHGRRTSIRLEPEMWAALKEIAKREKCTIHRICSVVYDRKNDKSSLTAAIRVFLMAYYRSAATEEGHAIAGHGYAVRHERSLRLLKAGKQL